MRRSIQRCASSLASRVANGSLSSQLVRRHACRVVFPHLNQSPSSRIAFHNITRVLNQAVAPSTVESEVVEAAPITNFADLEGRGVVHRNIVRNLKAMGLETMTDVQSATINEALNGTDIVAQAKTGTGKTVGFLLPVLQNILKVDPSLAEKINPRQRARTTAEDIRAIVISPTRELAEQIAVEAKKMVEGTGIVVQTAVGGSNKASGLRTIKRQGCHILIGTPGRLKDILSDRFNGVATPDLSAFVLDEADRLLDSGFWVEIKEILALLPDRKHRDRQTLLFSATMPKEVVGLVKSTLRPGFRFVRCINDDEAPTHERVPQKVVTVNGFENKLPALVEFVNRQLELSKEPGGRPFKAIVYYNAAAEVALVAEALRRMRGTVDRPGHPWGNMFVGEIQARLSQMQRDKATDAFRRCTEGIFVSSDVTARGMDFPNVTHVIQMGSPPSRETYVHRLGRTARAGKEGEGLLFLTAAESSTCYSRLRGIKLQPDNSLELATFDMTKAAELPANLGSLLAMTQKSMVQVDAELKAKAYRGMIGAGKGSMDMHHLMSALNNLAVYGWGLPSPPGLPRGLVNKLGLARISGVVIDDSPAPMSSREGFGGRSSRFGSSDRFPSKRFDSAGTSDRSGSVGFAPRRRFDRGASAGYSSRRFNSADGDRRPERGDSDQGYSSRSSYQRRAPPPHNRFSNDGREDRRLDGYSSRDAGHRRSYKSRDSV